MSRLCCYSRVGMPNSTLDLQTEELKLADRKIKLSDKINAEKTGQPVLDEFLKTLRPEDVLVVQCLSCFTNFCQHVSVVARTRDRLIIFKSCKKIMTHTTLASEKLFFDLYNMFKFLRGKSYWRDQYGE